MVLCIAVRCGAVRCGAVRCGAVRCGAVRCGAVRCGAVRCGAVRCGAVRCGVVSCRVKTFKGEEIVYTLKSIGMIVLCLVTLTTVETSPTPAVPVHLVLNMTTPVNAPPSRSPLCSRYGSTLSEYFVLNVSPVIRASICCSPAPCSTRVMFSSVFPTVCSHIV